MNIKLELSRVMNHIKRIIQDCEPWENVTEEIRGYLDMATTYTSFWDRYRMEIEEDGTCVVLFYLNSCDKPINMLIKGLPCNPGPEFVDWVKEGF